MTQEYVAPWISYATDATVTTFAYPWYVAAASELDAYHNGSATTAFSVTGVGNVNGGTLVFFSAPSAGTLFIRRRTPLTQLTDYTEHDAFAANTHEAALDKLQRQIQDLQEDLSRRPALAAAVANSLRNLLYPTPVAGKLWGWNATADGITYYDTALVQVTVDSVSGMAFAKTTVTVNASSGAGTPLLTASTVAPAGVLLLGVTARVTTTCGATGGLTTWSLGDAQMADRWATGINRTSGTVTNAGMWRNYAPMPLATSLNVLLFADAGLWDATGVLKVTAHYATFAPDA